MGQPKKLIVKREFWTWMAPTPLITMDHTNIALTKDSSSRWWKMPYTFLVLKSFGCIDMNIFGVGLIWMIIFLDHMGSYWCYRSMKMDVRLMNCNGQLSEPWTIFQTIHTYTYIHTYIYIYSLPWIKALLQK